MEKGRIERKDRKEVKRGTAGQMEEGRKEEKNE